MALYFLVRFLNVAMPRPTLLLTIFCLIVPILTASTTKCALGKRAGTTAVLAARACEPDGEDGSGGCDPCVPLLLAPSAILIACTTRIDAMRNVRRTSAL